MKMAKNTPLWDPRSSAKPIGDFASRIYDCLEPISKIGEEPA